MQKMSSSEIERLENRITSLSTSQLIAFAAFCAERQYGTYCYAIRQSGDSVSKVVRKSIDLCWLVAAGINDLSNQILEMRDTISDLVPDLTENDSAYASLVLDATSAADYALEICLTRSAASAIYASRCARNAVDEWIRRFLATNHDDETDSTFSIHPDEIESINTFVDQHPLMIAELENQNRAINYLEAFAFIQSDNCEYLRTQFGPKSNLGLE